MNHSMKELCIHLGVYFQSYANHPKHELRTRQQTSVIYNNIMYNNNNTYGRCSSTEIHSHPYNFNWLSGLGHNTIYFMSNFVHIVSNGNGKIVWVHCWRHKSFVRQTLAEISPPKARENCSNAHIIKCKIFEKREVFESRKIPRTLDDYFPIEYLTF